jgi:hypothetical protein
MVDPRRLAWLVLGFLVPAGTLAQSVDSDQLTPATTQQGSSSAQSRTEGALFLLLPSGAQGVAVGRAMTARSSSESAFWNPAGLAGLESSRVLLFRGDHVAGEATGISALLAGAGRGSLALSYQLLDVGTQDLRDPDGQVVGSISVRSHLGLVSGGISIGSRIRTGVNLKSLQYRVTCRGQCPDGSVSATSYATDLGIQARPLRNQPLELGLMVAHLGSDFQVEGSQQADPLPTRIRLGAAYDILDAFAEEDLGMSIMFELEDRLRDPGQLSYLVGAEFFAEAGAIDQVSIRGGYIFGKRNQTDGAGLGFGVHYDRVEFGIARSLARSSLSSGDEPVHVTLGFTF